MFINPIVAINVAVWNGAASIRHAKAGDNRAAIRCSNTVVGLADLLEDEDEYFLTVVRRLGRVRALALGFEPEFVAGAI